MLREVLAFCCLACDVCPRLVLLRELHATLVAHYDCKDTAPPRCGARGGHSSQDWSSQQQEAGPPFLPRLNRLLEAYTVRGEDVSNIDVNPIPSPRRLTHQAEQLRLRRPQRIVTTAVDSVLRTEMGDLESLEVDAPRRVLCILAAAASFSR
jgi:hypothetical protein